LSTVVVPSPLTAFTGGPLTLGLLVGSGLLGLAEGRPEDGGLLEVPLGLGPAEPVGDAAGALHAVHRQSLSVPADVSLVAINDAPAAAFLSPSITVVRMPLAELAGRAVARLFDVVQGWAVAGDLVVRTAPELIERESTGAPTAA